MRESLLKEVGLSWLRVKVDCQGKGGEPASSSYVMKTDMTPTPLRPQGDPWPHISFGGTQEPSPTSARHSGASGRWCGMRGAEEDE